MKINDKSDYVCRVSLHENVQIPPRSEKVELTQTMILSALDLLNPLENCCVTIQFMLQDLWLNQNVVPVHVVNTTNQTVKIDKKLLKLLLSRMLVLNMMNQKLKLSLLYCQIYLTDLKLICQKNSRLH